MREALEKLHQNFVIFEKEQGKKNSDYGVGK